MDAVEPSLRLKRRALARAQPLSAHLELTYRCNWRCVFCYNPRHHDRAGLSTGEWLDVLDQLRSLGTLSVTLTGGEPLTHPGFLEVATGARRRGFAVSVFTNGSLIDDRMADALAGLHPVAVELSLHGHDPATHDAATGRVGSLAALLAGLDRLLARGVRALLKTPLTHRNQAGLDDLIALAGRRGVPLRIDPTLTPRDDGDLSPLSHAASEEAVERLYRTLATAGRLPTAERFAGGTNCGLGRVTLAIDPEGSVYPCLQWRQRPLGNVRDAPLASAWRSAERERAAAVAVAANERLLALGGPVARLPYCPALAAQHTGDPLVPSAAHERLARVAERVRRGA